MTRKLKNPTGLMTAAAAFVDAGWQQVETQWGRVDGGVHGVRPLDTFRMGPSNILIQEQPIGWREPGWGRVDLNPAALQAGDVCVVLRKHLQPRGGINWYRVTIRRVRDDKTFVLEVKHDAPCYKLVTLDQLPDVKQAAQERRTAEAFAGVNRSVAQPLHGEHVGHRIAMSLNFQSGSAARPSIAKQLTPGSRLVMEESNGGNVFLAGQQPPTHIVTKLHPGTLNLYEVSKVAT